jgi:hypothetical protein
MTYILYTISILLLILAYLWIDFSITATAILAATAVACFAAAIAEDRT